MNTLSSSVVDFLQFLAFVLLLIGMPYFIGNSMRQLAKDFPAQDRPSGKPFIAPVKIGWVEYESGLRIYPSAQGIYLSQPSLIPFHKAPYVLIPWDSIHNAKVCGLLKQRVVFEVVSARGTTVKIQLPKYIFASRTVPIQGVND